MCAPGAMSQAKAIGKSRSDFSVEGVNLNNLKDSPRKLALNGAMSFGSLPGITLSSFTDPTRQIGT